MIRIPHPSTEDQAITLAMREFKVPASKIECDWNSVCVDLGNRNFAWRRYDLDELMHVDVYVTDDYLTYAIPESEELYVSQV